MLRQRTWAIFIRPYYERSMGGHLIRIDYQGVPKAGYISDLGFQGGTNTATALKGNGEGGSDGTAIMEMGGWTMWYTSTSFSQIKEKYKAILEDTAKENIKIVEILPTDLLVMPLS